MALLLPFLSHPTTCLLLFAAPGGFPARLLHQQLSMHLIVMCPTLTAPEQAFMRLTQAVAVQLAQQRLQRRCYLECGC